MVMDRVEEAGTYYRILWLLPMTVVIAYAGVKLIGKHTRIGLVALAAVCILGGSYVYGNVNVSKAENRYHLPAEVPAICDLIMPAAVKNGLGRVSLRAGSVYQTVHLGNSDALWARHAGGELGSYGASHLRADGGGNH